MVRVMKAQRTALNYVNNSIDFIVNDIKNVYATENVKHDDVGVPLTVISKNLVT